MDRLKAALTPPKGAWDEWSPWIEWFRDRNLLPRAPIRHYKSSFSVRVKIIFRVSSA